MDLFCELPDGYELIRERPDVGLSERSQAIGGDEGVSLAEAAGAVLRADATSMSRQADYALKADPFADLVNAADAPCTADPVLCQAHGFGSQGVAEKLFGQSVRDLLLRFVDRSPPNGLSGLRHGPA